VIDHLMVEPAGAAPSARQPAPALSPARAFVVDRWPAALLAAGVLLAIAITAYVTHGNGHARTALSLMFGAAFGIVLQRARFCFFCMFREWFDERDPRGLSGLLVALAVGLIGTFLVFGAWLPDASTGRLPPDAFIGPVGPALVIAGLAFGAGMAISGSCVSAHLYRLGEGSPTAPFALVGALLGFMLGFVSWNPIYLTLIADAPVIWLPRYFGYAGALIASFAVIGSLAYVIRQRQAPRRAEQSADGFTAIFVARWPAWIGGAIIGVLATLSYLRVAPLGVTAELGARARQLAGVVGVAPTRLEGLDSLRGCIAVVRDFALSDNGVFVLGVIGASFAAALVARQFKPSWPTLRQIVQGLLGGTLLGWGAMIGLGCTVGTLFSGISAGALSGWVFAAAVFGGTAITLWGGRRAGLLLRPR
jgi:uncharacterized protein